MMPANMADSPIVAQLRTELGERAESEAQQGLWDDCAATLRVILALCPDPMRLADADARQIAAQRRVVIKRTLRLLETEGLTA